MTLVRALHYASLPPLAAFYAGDVHFRETMLHGTRLGLCLAMCPIIAALLCLSTAQADAQTVDLAVVLAADVSRSVDDDEFKLQRQGYAAAVTNPRVLQAISAVSEQSHCHFLYRMVWSRRAAGGGRMVGYPRWRDRRGFCRDFADGAALLPRPHLD